MTISRPWPYPLLLRPGAWQLRAALASALATAVLALPSVALAREALAAPPPPMVSAPSAGQALAVPAHLFALAHPVGQQRLLHSDYNQAYWPLANYFATQRNQAYCSVATSVMALNAFCVARPACSASHTKSSKPRMETSADAFISPSQLLLMPGMAKLSICGSMMR